MPVILATQEAEIGGARSEANLSKSAIPYLKNKPSMVVPTYNFSYSEAEVGRWRFQACQGKCMRPNLKNTIKQKWLGTWLEW
jgi:hypothetical protein